MCKMKLMLPSSASHRAAHIIHTANELFLRMKRLAKMAKLELREEIISADLADHVMHGE